MKMNITTVGIILCLITACGIINSNKKEPFDPHSFDGVYSSHYQVYTTVDSLCKLCVGREFDIAFMKVDYPLFHTCIKQTNVSPYTTEGQEEVKVARKDSNLYEIKEVNGRMVTTNNIFYKITGHSTHVDGNINHYLIFNKIKNGKEHYSSGFENEHDGNLSEAYQECVRYAPDTTGIFPSAQKYAVKQN